MNSEKVRNSLFQNIFLEKNQILKFAGEILCLPLEMMLPPSLHTLSLPGVPAIDKYSRAKFASAGNMTFFYIAS